ncbi:MAG: flagellin hook IN motif-containing protein, partial [Woeseiaceae bacterium]|nr:flagellin hook IN motif-containing protein [Woeseiaceae bacterium]
TVDNGAEIDLRRARSQLLTIYSRLEDAAELLGVRSRFRLDLPDARSRDPLGLDLTTTAATLQSAEEINTAANSFTPFGPEWSGSSTAPFTVGGVYDGSDGNNTLTIQARRSGTRGVNDIRFRVTNEQGQRFGFWVRDHHPLDREYSLRNGLYVTLGPGSIVDREETTVQVFQGVGAEVDPSRPLGGIRNDNPNFEFGGPTIQNGSFTVNGENISVSTSDTLNDVIDRINQSNAGVTAALNDDRLDFLQDSPGLQPTIDLAGDTSNLLEALKLDTAAVVPGIDPENQQRLEDVAAFSTVTSGSIRINGRDIAIDTASDTLDSVIDRINSSDAEVRASFDSDSQRVVIEADDSARRMELDSNGTGLFAALNIAEGRVDSEVRRGGISRRRSYEVANALQDAFQAVNTLFRDASFVNGGQYTGRYRGLFQAALESVAGAGTLGLSVNNTTQDRARGDYTQIDRRNLTRNLQQRGRDVQEILLSRDGQGGLVKDMLAAARSALSQINEQLGITGTFVDTVA